MPKNLTYANVGVNRKQRAKSKKALQILEQTYTLSHYGRVMHLPYGNLFQLDQSTYLDLVIEGVGTKVLLAQLADKYDTIGIDAVAMAVNDIIRSGATPLAVSDNIHAQASNPALVKDWLRGIAEGAKEANCPVTSGEIGDVREIIRGIAESAGFDMVVASVGKVKSERIISGKEIKPDDQIIGLRSSGLHSNGITLARKVLFRQWGGKHEPHARLDGLDKDLALETLTPTKIYVSPVLRAAEELIIKAAVHITGDAYLKFDNLSRFSPGIGFEFTNFKPQQIFRLIQETAEEMGLTITDEEMFRTFNMGWGFALIVDKKDADKALNILEKAGVEPEQIGKVTSAKKVKILYEGKNITLS